MKLNTINSIIIKSTFAILCIYLCGEISSTLFNHVLKTLLIQWDFHPWFRLIIIGLEIWIAFLIFTKEHNTKRLVKTPLKRLFILTSSLLLLTLLKPYYEASYMVECYFSLLDGSLDGVFENMARNKQYVSIIEYILYALSILGIGIYINKFSNNCITYGNK